jgi:Tol biopolymer transport system component
VQIYVVNADGGGDRRLTAQPGENLGPVWSPDGQRIAYVSTQDGSAQIYVMNSDGSGQTKLTSAPAANAYPGWSPDSRRIVFTAFQEGNAALIKVMNADGSGQTELTTPPGENLAPSWSPDGQLIAFVARRGHPDPYPYVMNADGSRQRRLANVAIFLLPGAMELIWSRDSQRIFIAGVVAVDVANGRVTRLADGYGPSLSPDGRRIAFVSAPTTIYVMNVDGTGRRSLISGLLPAWSPDGSEIAFVSGDFFVINAQGGEPRRVALGAPNVRVGPYISWRPK